MQAGDEDEVMAAQPSVSQNELNQTMSQVPVAQDEHQVGLIEADESINCARFRPQGLNSSDLPLIATAHIVGSIKLHHAT